MRIEHHSCQMNRLKSLIRGANSMKTKVVRRVMGRKPTRDEHLLAHL